MELPTGTVTFLFTDIGDSTRLWEQHSAEMPEAIARHDAVLRGCVEGHGGIVVKSTGDGLMVVFADATDAVAAAIDSQRAIEAETWNVPIGVRMGLHTGAARPVDGDYHAPAVNRASRVAGAAQPGQILASAATSTLADSFGYLDLGEHALKGLAPMRLAQVEAPGLPRVFPPLSTTTATSPGLPVALTSFVGRDQQIDVVCDLVRHHPLVTLTGVGGCGKTRLAIEAATRIAADFPDGLRFVELAPVVDEAGVATAVTSALGLVEDPTADPRRRLALYLADRAVLLVLDNCEHLLDACAALVEEVLADTASRILATSREPLDVAGERVLHVRSLDVDTEAVPLFIDRASAVRPDFAVDGSNREPVAELCRRLDGMPLAIELAAAQTAHLSVSQILELLDDRFRLLVGGQRRVQRQQTLSATLDWSHQLLSDDDRAALRRLAVFPASFTLDAAHAVAGMDDTLRNLASLAAKSLLDVVEDGERFRYRLLETVRMYAEDKLIAAGEAAECRDRHRDWVAHWLESMPLDLRWLGDRDLLDVERANIRAALEWSSARGDATALARIASGIDWARSDAKREGMRWCEQAASIQELPRALQLQVLTNLTVLKVTSLDPDTLLWADRTIDLAHDEPGALLAVVLAWKGATLAVGALRTNDQDSARAAVRAAERSIAMSDTQAPPWQMYCRFVAGMVNASLATTDHRAYALAEAHYAAAAATAPDDLPAFGALRASLFEYDALFHLLGGRAETALLVARKAPSGDGRWPMFGQNGSAARMLALAATGAHEESASALRAMHENFQRNDVPTGPRIVCMYAGAIAAIEQEWERAATLLGAGREGVHAGAEAGLVYFHYRDLTRAALGAPRARERRDIGVALTVTDAIELALERDIERKVSP